MKKLLVLSALLALVATGAAGPAAADEVTGRVVDIDYLQGALTLQTGRGLLALQGPPEALENVKIGDLVRVRLALDEGAEATETSVPADDDRE